MNYDRVRKTNRRQQGFASSPPEANGNPEKATGADKIASKTWLTKSWTGEKWLYVRAARLPKLTAKFLSRSAALRAAEAQLQIVNKNKFSQ
jgi:hypothetical protein